MRTRLERRLRTIERLIWLLIGGGALWFIGCTMIIAALHPQTPANQLVNWYTIWFYLPAGVLVVTGVTVSVRYWRCADCDRPLPTKFRVPDVCPRCGRVLRDAASY